MKILDWYILKRYLGTFATMLLLFIPIGIIIDLAEKIDNILDSEAPKEAVLQYYLDFIVYFANLLFPLLLFLSVIWFTSKLANKTEIVAMLSSGISFWRFLRPYIIGATIVCVAALAVSLFLAPKASKGFNEFKYAYLKRHKKVQNTNDVYRQINDNEYIYASNFDPVKKFANNFTLEHFEGNKMLYKISANRIKYIEEDSLYRLSNFVKRTVKENDDILITERSYDTILPFDIETLTAVSYVAETLNAFELHEFIAQEERKASPDLNSYKVTAYKRWSIPVSAFILTLIGVAVSAMKRRGGMGANLAFGIGLAFGFIFIDKIFGTMAIQSDFDPLVAVWLPNVLFGLLAVYLLYNAKR